MIDVPLSIVAWIIVVVVAQAIIHYTVLGFRPQRKEEDENIDDDVIVFAPPVQDESEGTTEPSTPPTTDDTSTTATGDRDTTATSGVHPSDSRDDDSTNDSDETVGNSYMKNYMSNDQHSPYYHRSLSKSSLRYRRPSTDDYFAQVVVRRSLYSVIRNEDLLDGDEPPDFMEILTQTGSELLKSKSVECLVQEQIEMRSQ